MHLYSIISALMFILVATCEFLYTSKRLIDRVDMLNPPSLFLIEWSPISYYHRQNILWRHFWKMNSLLWWIRHSQNLHSQKSTRKHSRHFVLFLFLKTHMRNIASDWVRITTWQISNTQKNIIWCMSYWTILDSPWNWQVIDIREHSSSVTWPRFSIKQW